MGSDTQRMSGDEAVQAFESMLAAQMLKAAREAGKAWGAEESEAGSEAYLEFAEQHLARSIAERGVLGFADLLKRDLKVQPPPVLVSGSRA